VRVKEGEDPFEEDKVRGGDRQASGVSLAGLVVIVWDKDIFAVKKIR
jgi:hypothetical protein